ncbi:MAG: TonB-dependent receptor plug domain-containing protein, partial [Cytophagales bacterium]|nr:TonB-dependent receptor plug domain-containing protein [Cytophagales bacterium]
MHNRTKNLLRQTCAFGFVFLSLSPLLAQQKHTISGYLRDASSGEELIGATVLVQGLRNTGAATNIYGFYSITLPEGNYELLFSSIGYTDQIQTVKLDQDQRINISLTLSQTELKEVVVESYRIEENVENIQMSRETMQVSNIKKLPALFGEVDVIRAVQLLPGVQTAGEGSSGLFVRGGSNDQNLILLDEAPVFNASHLMGFFSVFNPDAVK